MKILAAIGMALLLNGCIVIPVAALIGAKLVHMGHEACEKSPDRCPKDGR